MEGDDTMAATTTTANGDFCDGNNVMRNRENDRIICQIVRTVPVTLFRDMPSVLDIQRKISYSWVDIPHHFERFRE